MFRHAFTAVALSAGMLLGSASAFAADPSIQQVYAAANAGHLDQAQQMMHQVLRDHPDSGKAHFVEAELLAKQGDLSGARNELNTAERIDPGLPFAKPGSVQELKSLLASATPRNTVSKGVSYANVPSHSGFPFGLIAVLLIGGAIVAYMMRRRSRPVVMHGAPNGNAFGNGAYPSGPASTYYGNGPAPMPQSGGGMGSGIMGGLATGAAMGAGIVAGEALVHRVLDGGSHTTQAFSAPVPSGNWDDVQPGAQNYDMGGNDFGINDDSSWDDGSSSGGDDW